MTRKERYEGIVGWFSLNRPVAETELHYDSPFHLLLAVILSAQCTDRRVNMVTPALFERFPDPASMAEASAEEIFPYIKSISYPSSKAAHLRDASRMIVEDFGGDVPSDRESLKKLPGVGQKTANVMMSVVHGAPVIAVDTHVFRVAHRLGLSSGKTPLDVEKDLEKNIPVDRRAISHHWLILHGRYVCTARSPRCDECEIRQWCKDWERRQKNTEKEAR